MVWLPVFVVYNVRADADASNFFSVTVKESELNADSGRKKNPLPHRWPEPVSVMHLAFWTIALPTELSLTALANWAYQGHHAILHPASRYLTAHSL